MSTPDRNFRSVADVDGYELSDQAIDPREQGLDPAIFDDLLKLSNAKNIVVARCLVRGGGWKRENAIDLNRNCRNVLIVDTTVESGKQNAITIKGGSQDTTLRRILIERAGGSCDLELGGHSDQSFDRVKGTRIESSRRLDGKPIRVRCGDADWPTVQDSNVQILYFQSVLLKIYVWAKRLGKSPAK